MTTASPQGRALNVLKKLLAAKTERRLDALLGEFEDRHIQGWHMCVPDCFRDPLDMLFTPKVEKKQTSKSWTQGSIFNFKEGYVVYNTITAYNAWAVIPNNDVRIGLQVLASLPSSPANAVTKQWDSLPNEEEISLFVAQHTDIPKAFEVENKLPASFTVKAYKPRQPGYLKLNVLKTTAQGQEFKSHGSIEVSQDDFVHFLISGQTGLPHWPEIATF